MALMLDSFICDYCNKSFTRKYNLRVHIENCHLNSATFCDICEQLFGSPSGLALHLSRGHNRNNESFPECDLCGRIFKRKQNIVSHMITIHLQGTESKCSVCNKTFTTQRNLKRHINQIHNPAFEHLQCDHCCKIFKGKHSLIAHIQALHGPSERCAAKCSLCNKVYTNNSNLKRHIESHHGERGQYKCCLCTKVYTSNQSLRRHHRIRHNPTKQNYSRKYLNLYSKHHKYTCEECSARFLEEYHLRQHIKSTHSFSVFYNYCRKSLLKQEMRKKTVETIYKCEYCHNDFTNVYDLKDHMRVIHEKEYCLSTCNVCFTKFYCKETILEHKKDCIPPRDAKSCTYCDKLFTDHSSLEFHTRIFHPQSQVADLEPNSANHEELADEISPFRCIHCERVYYSDRSLKHHIKLKHTTDEAVECGVCGKICSNKYYLASHMKIVHSDNSWSKCDYCDKQFKSKRNIRRHIEYTHLGMQRYKCIECETLFKEKRSLRKHVRTKHPDSTCFPQCHICEKRFESAKSCKIHLKLMHSFNMNTHPCHQCSVSFSSYDALKIHLQTNHLAEDEIYKCESCNLVFKGQDKFESHNDLYHINASPSMKQKLLPRCILCIKDFSTRKTLKRHIKKFHSEFDVEELANFGSRRRIFNVECDQCLKKFNDDAYIALYHKMKASKDAVIFNCTTCSGSYSPIEFAIQKYKQQPDIKSKMILSELCTTEMSDGAEDYDVKDFGSFHDDLTKPDIVIKEEPLDDFVPDIVKSEPLSP